MSLRHVVLAGAFGSSLATLLPHTLLIDKYREFKAKYRLNQTEEPFHEKTKKLCEEVFDDIKLSNEERKLIRPFHAFGYNICSAGTLCNSKYGAVIGIPMNYLYEDINAVDKDHIFFKSESIDWTKKSANDFLEAIILSENAQKYAIAREVLKVKNTNLRYEVIQISLHVTLIYAIYHISTVIFKLHQRRKLWRFILGISTLTVGVTAWSPLRIRINSERDKKIDEKVSKLGPTYIAGAIEYYDKLLSRNMALKSMLNDTRKNSKLYNYEHFFIWARGATLSERKDFFNLKNIYSA